MLATSSIAIYFVLNVWVTITNRSIIQRTSSPNLLTASHASASFLSTSIIALFQPPPPRLRLAYTHRVYLILFSALFTINITFSNFTLGLVSLTVHQTIRATAPILTIPISVLLQLKTWNSYDFPTYLSLIPITSGAIIAAISTPKLHASLPGLLLTFVGAVTAVCKTLATHTLQKDMSIKGYQLIRITSPLAVVESLIAAWYHSEFTTIVQQTSQPRNDMWSSYAALGVFILVNGLLAAALNIASFEANRQCGALSMGVAANLKQVAILFVPDGGKEGKGTSKSTVLGCLVTVTGGLWYAVVQRRQEKEKEKERMVEREMEEDMEMGKGGG